MSLCTCKICDCNSKLRTCSLCQVICCEPCLESHQASCSVMKEHHFHMCKVDRDQQVCGYCHHCSELICENCRYVHHKNHVIVPMKTAFDNIRKDMPMVGQDLDMKYNQLKTTMGIQEKDHLLSQQKMGTSIKPTNQHLQLELLQEAKTNFDFLGKESFPLAFLSKWSCVQHALTKYKQLHSTTTESPQSHEQMTSHVPDVSQTFGNSVIHSDGTHVNEPSKDKSVDGVDEIAELLNKKLTIDDNSRHDMSSSTPSLPGEDVIEGGFVHIPNATDTSENKDNSSSPNKHQVEKLQKDMKKTLVEGKQMIKQWRRGTEENAGQRGTIEGYTKQIADMSKQLELHKQEKDYILTIATSMIPWIADINERKTVENICKFGRPENMSVDSFVDNMELILKRVTDMKKEMLTTEGNLAAKLADVGKWTDEQRQTEEGLNREIQDKAKTIQFQRAVEENAQLRCTIERSEEQIAEMSKQLGLHQQEKDYILSMATSMMPRIADINERKVIVNSYKLDRPEDICVGSFVDNMEQILVCVTAMKNDMLTTEGNLAAKCIQVANWMDEQRQTEDGFNRKIQDQAKTIDAQDKDLKIMLLSIQEINSASANTKNENNRLRQQIFDNEKKADQQQTNQSHMNNELKRSLHNMNTNLQQRAAHIESLQRAMQDLQYQIAQKDDKIKDFKREAEDLRTRLSSLAGDKLTKGNPAITDLGDPNRPMKLAEKYGELYDNEWTDALDSTVEMKALYPDMKAAEIEEVIIRHLYQLVMCCYRECLLLSKKQLKEVGNTIVNALNLNTEEHDRDIPGCKEVSTFRRQTAAEYADYLFKHKVFVDKIVLSNWEYKHKSNELVGLLTETPFFDKCVHLCWHMAIQDPVMHLDEELTPDAAYDKNVYRDFVKSGDKVTFVVWPALFLHEDGPLLNKGVVQAYR